MKIKYLVTGTGRCGTVFLARFLTSIGIGCTHEAIFNIDGIDQAKKRLEEEKLETSLCSIYDCLKKEDIENWIDLNNVYAESSYMAAPFLEEEILKETKIIHVVRSPMEVLSSWVLDVGLFSERINENEKYQTFILEQIPQIKDEKTIIEKNCRFIIEWTKLIEKAESRIIVKIEEYPFVNLTSNLENIDLSKKIENKKINSWNNNRKDITKKEIPEGKTKEEFLNYIEKYGYKWFTLL